MYCIACAPVPQLFDSPAEILGEWAVDGFEFAARSHDRNESGYPVNGCPKLRFAGPQRLFRPLALCHILGRADVLQSAVLVSGLVSDYVQVLDRVVRHLEPVLVI